MVDKMMIQKALRFLLFGLILSLATIAGKDLRAQTTPSETEVNQTAFPQNALFGPSEFLAGLPQQEKTSDSGVFFKSFLLPGWGQHSLKAPRAKRNFIISELTLWGAVVALVSYGRWLENDYKAFAAVHAGVRADGYDYQFWVDIGNYDSVDQWNDAALSDRNLRDLRDPNGDEAWQWDSRENRITFDNTRIASDRAFERAGFTIAAIIGNHLISGLHALWLKRKQRRLQEETVQQARFDIRLLPGAQRGSRLALVMHF